MKRLALLTIAAAFVVGCGSGGDPELAEAAPPAGPNAQDVQPNMNKPMPGAAGASGMESQPLAKPN